MSVTSYPTLRLKLTVPQALKLQFLPAIPGSNAAASAAAAQAAADAAAAAANTAVAATANKVDKTGDVMTGFLTLNANPTANLQAATKQYVDSQVTAGGITPQLPVLGGHLAGFTDSTGHVLREVIVGATMTIDGTGTLNTTAGGGNVMAVGGPTSGQYAKWTSAVQIQGVAATTVLSDIGAQPLDADLTAIAALTGTNTIYYRSAANTWSPIVVSTGLAFSGGNLTATGGAAAPIGAEYITSTADATLTAERVLTDTATVTWDRATAGQIKANAAGGGGAPIGAEYITSTTDATLTAERVLTDTATVTWDRATAGQIKANATGGSATPVPPQGRLTLQTATPVMTSTQAAKTTIFYTPYQGSLCPIYDGANFSMSAFSELSVLTTDTTKSPAAIGASKCNDWFVWNDAGTLRIGHGPDWTSDTARSAGTALVMVGGILLNSVALTNGAAIQRGTYVGTTRSNASSQLDWIYGGNRIAAVLGVWNVYNRVRITTSVTDDTSSWTYNNSIYRIRNSPVTSTAYVYIVLGLQEDAVEAFSWGRGITDASLNQAVNGIGLDAVTTLVGTQGYAANVASITTSFAAHWNGMLLGAHIIYAVEASYNGGAPQWLGLVAPVPVRVTASFDVSVYM